MSATILKLKRDKYGSINPNELKGYCFPNWFEKEHFEIAMRRKLTLEEFEVLKDYVVQDLMDEISNSVFEYLAFEGKKILQDYRKENK